MVMVSVIIPVFNAEKYLKNCIESLLAQTLETCEFIFINDGSVDKSKSIIETFREADSRIMLIEQQNQGVSAARNAGLKAAKGQYIGFADADDTVAPNHFDTLFGLAQKQDAEIVVSRYILHRKGKQLVSTPFFPEHTTLDEVYIKKEIIPFFIRDEGQNAIWNKLYKHSLLQQNGISFPVGIALGEDGLFNIAAFSKAKTVYFTDYAGYQYVENDGSATRDFASKEYYRAIVSEYQRDDSAFANAYLDPTTLSKLKAEKFLRKTISLLHEYANPVHGLRFSKAYAAISLILNDAVFARVLKKNYSQFTTGKGRYERLVARLARNKWIFLLFAATAYSRFRNQ